MTITKFPAGPWWANKNSVGVWDVLTYRDDDDPTNSPHIGSSYGAHICMSIGDHTEKRTSENPEAIAHLIAAAPALYAALEGLLAASQPQRSDKPGFVYIGEAQEAASAALSLARGEA